MKRRAVLVLAYIATFTLLYLLITTSGTFVEVMKGVMVGLMMVGGGVFWVVVGEDILKHRYERKRNAKSDARQQSGPGGRNP